MERGTTWQVTVILAMAAEFFINRPLFRDVSELAAPDSIAAIWNPSLEAASDDYGADLLELHERFYQLFYPKAFTQIMQQGPFSSLCK